MYKNTDTKINNKKKYKLELAPRLGAKLCDASLGFSKSVAGVGCS